MIIVDKISLLRKTKKEHPDSWEVCCNLAHYLHQEDQTEEALVEIEKALKLSNVEFIRYNAGIIHSHLGNTEKAINYFSQCTDLTAKFALSLEFLSLGRWKEGWKEYENRFTSRETTNQNPMAKKIRDRYKQPDWNGKPVDTLFIYEISAENLKLKKNLTDLAKKFSES